MSKQNITLKSILIKMAQTAYSTLDEAYIKRDRQDIRRSRNLRLVPAYKYRLGGKRSYVEWGHVVGIFQTLFSQYLEVNPSPDILDIGCGAGILAIASEPFVKQGGSYCGIDVSAEAIKFCQKNYRNPAFQFQHLDVHNAMYAEQQRAQRLEWNVADETKDMVTALSVWTHLNEDDAVFYFQELSRVLKPGGRAIVTFFLLDDFYELSLDHRTDDHSKYHLTSPSKWIFQSPVSSSGQWFSPDWVKSSEEAIGISPKGLEMLLDSTGLRHVRTHLGNWKEIPGIFFQDILVFEKLSS